MSWDRIIAETHELLQEHRRQMGLPPWDFSKPKRARPTRLGKTWDMFKSWVTRREKAMAKAAGVEG